MFNYVTACVGWQAIWSVGGNRLFCFLYHITQEVAIDNVITHADTWRGTHNAWMSINAMCG